MINNKSNSELKAELDKLIIGHDQAKKYLINILNRAQLRAFMKYERCIPNDELIAPGKLLLIGESGTGKTFLVQCLQKILPFPLVYIDATKMTPTGAGAGIKSTDIQGLVKDAAKEFMARFPGLYKDRWQAIEATVVFIDEVDKLASAWESSGHWNKHVQSNFLTLFEPSSTPDNISGVTYIFAGAFANLKKRRQLFSKSIGFTKTDGKEEHAAIQDEDIVEYGLIPEFVGRISAIVELDRFTEVDYYNILTYKLLPEKRREMEKLGIYNAIIGENDLQAIVKRAISSGQGVRALKRGLELFFIDLEFEYEKYMVDYTQQPLLEHQPMTQDELDAELLSDELRELLYDASEFGEKSKEDKKD